MDTTMESEDTKMNKRRTSRREQKNKRLKRVQIMEHREVLTLDETNAAQQGKAIVKHNGLVIHTPHLKRFYFCDGFKFNTGEHHRHIG